MIEEQAVARAYDAVCTPDFFGFDGDRKLKYRGRLDEGRTAPPPPGARRELVEAMRDIAGGRPAAAGQVPPPHWLFRQVDGKAAAPGPASA